MFIFGNGTTGVVSYLLDVHTSFYISMGLLTVGSSTGSYSDFDANVSSDDHVNLSISPLA